MLNTKSFLFAAAVFLSFYSLSSRLPSLETSRMWPDEALYSTTATAIFNDPYFAFSKKANELQPALFPAVIAPGLFLFPSEMGLRAMTLSINVLGLIAVFILGCAVGGPWVGMTAFLLLGANIHYIVHGNLILIDGLFTLVHIAMAYALLRVDPNRIFSVKDAMVVLTIVAAVLLKWYALILLLPVVAVYYLFAFEEIPFRSRVFKLSALFGILALVLGPYLFYLVSKIQEGVAVFFPKPFWHYLVYMPDFLSSPILFVLFLVGLFSLKRYPRRIKCILYAWIPIELLILSLVPEKDFRYILPTLPFFVLVAAIGFYEFLFVVFKSRIAVISRNIFLVVFTLVFIQDQTRFVHQGINWNYVGFKQAGEWINAQNKPDALFFAGSTRAMTYFSNRPATPFPKELQEFKDMLNTHKGPVFLETDIWEYTQPSWVYPVTADKIRLMEQLGFGQAHAVHSRYYKAGTTPVVWVWSKNAEKI